MKWQAVATRTDGGVTTLMNRSKLRFITDCVNLESLDLWTPFPASFILELLGPGTCPKLKRVHLKAVHDVEGVLEWLESRSDSDGYRLHQLDMQFIPPPPSDAALDSPSHVPYPSSAFSHTQETGLPFDMDKCKERLSGLVSNVRLRTFRTFMSLEGPQNLSEWTAGGDFVPSDYDHVALPWGVAPESIWM